MVNVRKVLRDEGRDVGASGDGGSVGVIPDEADAPVEGADAQELFQVLDIEFNLGIQAGVPVRGVVRVVDGQAAVQFAQDALDVAVVRLYQGGIQLRVVLFQAEVNLLEGALAYGNGQAFIADERSRKHPGLGRACFQGVAPVHVGGNADGGSVKIDAHKGDGLSGICVGDHPSHARCTLGGRCNGCQKQEEKECPSSHKKTKLTSFSEMYKD